MVFLLVNCANCNKEVNRKPCYVKKYKRSFCDKGCQNTFQKKHIHTRCATCDKSISRLPSQFKKSKSGRHFCGPSCSAVDRNKFITGEDHPNYKTGAYRYRKRALAFYGEFCMNPKCILSKLIDIPVHMLDVDHIDENRKNNKIENLRVVCVWCHALKTRRHWVKV